MKRILSFMLAFMMVVNLITPSMASAGKTYKVSVSKSSGGTVDGIGSYKEGALVVITAEAKEGYEFTGWTQIKGVEIDYIDSEEISFEMPDNRVSMKANFKKIQTYKVTVSKSSGGTVEGAGSYKEGALVFITAEPKDGYKFSGWSNIKGIQINSAQDEEIMFNKQELVLDGENITR